MQCPPKRCAERRPSRLKRSDRVASLQRLLPQEGYRVIASRASGGA